MDATILVVLDPDTPNGAGVDLDALLRDEGYVTEVSSPADWLRSQPNPQAAAHLALVDATDAGIDAAGRIRRELEIPVVYLTDGAGPELLERCDDTGPSGYLAKPVSRVQLSLAIRSALSVHAREARRRDTEVALRQQIDALRLGAPLTVGDDSTIDRMPHPYDQSVLLNAMLDTMSDGVIVVDGTSGIVYANDSARAIIRMPVQDVPPEEWPATYGVFDADGSSLVRWDAIPLVRALAGESVEGEEFVVRNANRPDGATVLAVAHPLLSADGQHQIGAFGIMRDLTEQKRTEEKLEEALRTARDQETLLSTVLESMSDGVVVADGSGRLTIFNTAAEEMVGVGILAVDPEDWSNAYGLHDPKSGELLPFDTLPLARAIAGKPTDGMELLVRNTRYPDGQHIRVDARPLRRDLGGEGGGVAIVRDVSVENASRAAEIRSLEQARQQAELMETVFDSVSEGIIVGDENGDPIRVNQAATQMGFPINTNGSDEAYYPDRRTPVAPADFPLRRAALRGESVEAEDFVLVTDARPDGITIRMNARPLFGEGKTLRGSVAIFWDVTETRRAEDALAEAFSRGKLDIIDTVLHNVGNAINSVTTGVETIHAAIGDDELMRRLNAVVEAVQAHEGDWPDYIANDPRGQLVLPFLIALRDDLRRTDERILKAATKAKDRASHIAEIIRTQRIFVKDPAWRKEVILADVIGGAIGLLEESLSKRGVRVGIDCAAAPETIKTHESDFQQMLVNLLQNAMDAIDERRGRRESGWTPGIDINAFADESYLFIEVADNGIGIAKDKRKHVLRAGYTTKKDGSGLGLHSVANFVNRTGGRVDVRSRGTTGGTTIKLRMRLAAIGVHEDVSRTEVGDAGTGA